MNNQKRKTPLLPAYWENKLEELTKQNKMLADENKDLWERANTEDKNLRMHCLSEAVAFANSDANEAVKVAKQFYNFVVKGDA